MGKKGEGEGGEVTDSLSMSNHKHCLPCLPTNYEKFLSLYIFVTLSFHDSKLKHNQTSSSVLIETANVLCCRLFLLIQ